MKSNNEEHQISQRPKLILQFNATGDLKSAAQKVKPV